MFAISFPDASPAQLDDLFNMFRKHYDTEGFLQTRLYEGAWDVLNSCRDRGISVDVATNKVRHISTAILAHLKVTPYIRSVVTCDSSQPPFAGKAEMIEYVLKTNRLTPAQALFVGDSADDAMGCAACGIRFIWAAYGYGKLTPDQSRSAWATIHKLAELPPLLV